MTAAVALCALGVAALNLAAGALGGWRWYRGATSRVFWVLLRLAQASTLVLALLVGALAAAGHDARSGLFYLYALLPVAVGLVAEQLRVASAETVLAARDLENAQAVGRLPDSEQRAIVLVILRREMGVMALAAVIVCFLALRAAGTASF